MIVILICGGLLIFATLVMTIYEAARRPGPPTPEDRERLLALEFRGVVVENVTVAHAFDAGYECRVKIKCDDGMNVLMTTSVFEEGRFPVGARVVKRAGMTRPEREPG